MFKTRIQSTLTAGLLGLVALAPATQAAPAYAVLGSQAPIILAETQGMERRQDRRDDRQDCRQEEGVVGKDKRDCKQDERQDRLDGDDGNNNEKGDKT